MSSFHWFVYGLISIPVIDQEKNYIITRRIFRFNFNRYASSYTKKFAFFFFKSYKCQLKTSNKSTIAPFHFRHTREIKICMKHCTRMVFVRGHSIRKTTWKINIFHKMEMIFFFGFCNRSQRSSSFSNLRFLHRVTIGYRETGLWNVTTSVKMLIAHVVY